MERAFVVSLIEQFNAAGVRYLIAGGFAVNAHGFMRYTADLDLILDVDSQNALKALEILKAEGYTPKIPVPIEQFADAAIRKDWVENRNMLAFPLYSERHRTTGVDLFVNDPLPFDEAYARRLLAPLGTVEVSFVGLEDLLFLKHQAGRPKDKMDIQNLEEKRELENQNPD